MTDFSGRAEYIARLQQPGYDDCEFSIENLGAVIALHNLAVIGNSKGMTVWDVSRYYPAQERLAASLQSHPQAKAACDWLVCERYLTYSDQS